MALLTGSPRLTTEAPDLSPVVGGFVMPGGAVQSIEVGTLDDLDEGLRWATAEGTRVWDYIDKLLDHRLRLMAQPDAQG